MLSEDQQLAVDLIKSKKSVFISGNAGSGKSYLLKHLKETIPYIHLTASTGVAAIGIGGRTIHSWCGIGLGKVPANKLIFSWKLTNKIRQAKILAIDEVSMISAELLDLVNDAIKIIRRNDNPFGNLQILLFGDFFQLPPVNGDFCFNSDSWKALNPTCVILRKIFRQSDDSFVGLLQNVRYACLTEDDKNLLTKRIGLVCEDIIQPVKLVSDNGHADFINKDNLAKIKSEIFTYKAKYTGHPDQLDFLKKNCLAYDTLTLKIGASVMMLKNTFYEVGIINGSLGVVTSIDVFPKVLFENGEELIIMPEVWTLEHYDDFLGRAVIDASIEQVPLIFSWAITIHKSQGLTLSKIRCDLSKVFTYGQSYVALSRVTSLEGLYIDDIDFNKIRTSEYIIKFYESLQVPKSPLESTPLTL